MPADEAKKIAVYSISIAERKMDSIQSKAGILARVCDEKKIPHEFRELPGAHNWNFWDAQVQEFFRLAKSL